MRASTITKMLVLCGTLALLAPGCKNDEVNPPEEDTGTAVDQQVQQPDQAQQQPDQAVADKAVAGPDLPPKLDKMPIIETWKKCKVEIDLTTLQPCICYKTLVWDVATQYPDCVAPQRLLCCPAEGKPKCE